jgi:hypothetical protein
MVFGDHACVPELPSRKKAKNALRRAGTGLPVGLHYALGQLGYMADSSYFNRCRFGRGSLLRVGL